MFRSESRCLGPVDEGEVSKGFYFYLLLCPPPWASRVGVQRRAGSQREQPVSLSSSDPKQAFLNIKVPCPRFTGEVCFCADSRSQPQKM